MLQITKLIELADQCYDLVRDASNPDVMKALQDMGDQYMRKADELRRDKIIKTVYPTHNNAV
jgi:hypothetical protein